MKSAVRYPLVDDKDDIHPIALSKINKIAPLPEFADKTMRAAEIIIWSEAGHATDARSIYYYRKFDSDGNWLMDRRESQFAFELISLKRGTAEYRKVQKELEMALRWRPTQKLEVALFDLAFKSMRLGKYAKG